MSNTPRTEAALQTTENTTAIYVFADFARELEREQIALRKQIEKLEAEWREEHRIIECLVAAGFVAQAKVDEARTLVRP